MNGRPEAEEDRRFAETFDAVQAKVANGEAGDWEALLQREKSVLLPTLNNAVLIFLNDPKLHVLMRYNEFTLRTLMDHAPPEPPGLGRAMSSLPGPWPQEYDPDIHLTPLMGYFERRWSSSFKLYQVDMAAKYAGQRRHYHPVRDYLESLTWDGIPRIDLWLCDAFGCPDDEYHRAVASKVLVAAVRRAFDPGCKFDSMLVIEGEQDIGKSTVFRKLMPDEAWFSDSLHGNLKDRDAPMSMMGAWITEMAEIEQIIRHEAEIVKAFLSRQTDRIRTPYGKVFKDFPRQGILVGTTNAFDWLRDPTGNRRFWPVHAVFARHAWVEEFRDQLWAEALIRARDPAQTLFLDTTHLRASASEAQQARTRRDPWEDRITAYLQGRSMIRVSDVMGDQDGLNIEIARQDQLAAKRVKDVLTALGWKPDAQRYARNDNKTTRVWVPSHADAEQRPEVPDDTPFD